MPHLDLFGNWLKKLFNKISSVLFLRIAILSDFHFGFAARSERERDAFLQASQAIGLALKQKPDFLLVAGDIFDSDAPSPEAMHDCFEALSQIRSQKADVEAELVERSAAVKKLSLSHVPVFAIHGTHEFRGKDHKNILQACDAAGFVIYLHAAKAIVKKGSETVCVFGLGGVPEKFALGALQQWNPAPEKGAFNILMLHQSIKEFLPTDDEMSVSISLDDIPQGFELVVDGHLHWNNEKKLRNSLLLLPGSTVTTQMKNLESKKPKGFFLFDTASGKAEFLEIPSQRRFFYEKMKFESASAETVRKAAYEKLSEFASQEQALIPLVRLKLVGSLAKGACAADLNLASIESEFCGKMILSLDQDFEIASMKKRIEELRELQKSKASISELGISLLEKKLSETGFENSFDVRRVFQLLAEGETEKAEELLLDSGQKKEEEQ